MTFTVNTDKFQLNTLEKVDGAVITVTPSRTGGNVDGGNWTITPPRHKPLPQAVTRRMTVIISMAAMVPPHGRCITASASRQQSGNVTANSEQDADAQASAAEAAQSAM